MGAFVGTEERAGGGRDGAPRRWARCRAGPCLWRLGRGPGSGGCRAVRTVGLVEGAGGTGGGAWRGEGRWGRGSGRGGALGAGLGDRGCEGRERARGPGPGRGVGRGPGGRSEARARAGEASKGAPVGGAIEERAGAPGPGEPRVP